MGLLKIASVGLIALAALTPTSSAQQPRATARTVWDEAEDGASLSPDGTRVAFIDWSSGDIAVRNVTTGVVARVSDKGVFAESVGFPEPFLVFSPDGSRIVYPFGNPQAGEPFRYELRMVGIDGAMQQLLAAYPPEIEFVAPLDWDARLGILLTTVGPDGSSQLQVMQPNDGSVRILEHRSAASGLIERALFAPESGAVVYLANGSLQQLSLKGGSARMLGIKAEALLGWSPDRRKLLFHGSRGKVMGIWSVTYTGGRVVDAPTLEQSTAPGVIAGGRSTEGVAFLEPVVMDRLYLVGLDLARGQVNSPEAIPLPVDSIPGNLSWSPDGARLAFTLRAPNRITHRVVVSEGLRGPRRDVASIDLRVMGLAWSADGKFLVVGGRADTRQLAWVGRINVASGAVERLVQVPVNAVAAVGNDGVAYVRAAPAGERTVRVSVLAHPGATPRVLATYTATELPRSMSVSPDGKWVALIKPVGSGSALLLLPVAGGEPRTLLNVERPDRLELNVGSVPWTADSRALVVLWRRMGQRQLATVNIDSGELTMIPFSPESGGRWYPAIHPSGREMVYIDGPHRTELKLIVHAPSH